MGIVKALVAGIREVDPHRLIVADGIYLPKAVSHYTATWVPKDEFESFNLPTWPLKDDKGTVWDRARLKSENIDPYKPLVAKGVQIHVGEWGCFNKTAHAEGPCCSSASLRSKGPAFISHVREGVDQKPLEP